MMANEGIFNNYASGNAIIMETDKGECFGLTIAHNLNPKQNEKLGLLLGIEEVKTDDAKLNFYNIQEISNFTRHGFYNIQTIWEEKVKFDLSVFSLKRKDALKLLHKFKGNIYNGTLISGNEYEVNICSYGPSFDNNLTSFTRNTYHETSTTLTYDSRGVFLSES